MHNNPEFETFTYGHRPGLRSAAAHLRMLEKGDSVFFRTRLVDWDEDDAWGRGSLYLIGRFVLDRVLLKADLVANPKLTEIVKKNIHVMRWQLSPYLEPRNFRILVGSEESARFRHAVPFDERVLASVMQASDKGGAEHLGCVTGHDFALSGDRTCPVICDSASISNLEKYVRGCT